MKIGFDVRLVEGVDDGDEDATAVGSGWRAEAVGVVQVQGYLSLRNTTARDRWPESMAGSVVANGRTQDGSALNSR
jgi:hypothetical protein